MWGKKNTAHLISWCHYLCPLDSSGFKASGGPKLGKPQGDAPLKWCHQRFFWKNLFFPMHWKAMPGSGLNNICLCLRVSSLNSVVFVT